MFSRALFRDRAHAGAQLGRRVAALLAGGESTESNEPPKAAKPLVLGLPRGGVVVAAEIARALHAPLDIIVVRKLGAPWQPELALGAVVDVHGRPEALLNRETIEALGVDDAFLQRAIRDEHAEALRRLRVYRGADAEDGSGRQAPMIEGRTVIVADDGIATGATVRAALQLLRRQHPQRLILAVPVAPADLLDALRREVDDVVCLASPPNFSSVGAAYERFDQTGDAEVIELLQSVRDDQSRQLAK